MLGGTKNSVNGTKFNTPETIICEAQAKKQVCEENTNGAVQAKKSIR